MMVYAASYVYNTKNTKRGMKGLEKMTEQKRIVKMMRLTFVN